MWPEVEKAQSEKRHELVLWGAEISQRLQKQGLDPQIFQLTNLNYLDLHDTTLDAVPDEISLLANLQSLVLHSNKLQDFNVNITKLTKLKLLDLSANQLRQVPEEINNLTYLASLNLANNELESFPKLASTRKLTVLYLSNNKLKQFPEICFEELPILSELTLNDNEIEGIPAEVKNMTMVKVLKLGNNKITVVPGELGVCTKLKVLDLKNNPIADRRLFKLIDGGRLKQIMDYVMAHGPRTARVAAVGDENSESEESTDEENYRHVITVHYAKDNVKVVIDDTVKPVREYFIACLVNNITFNEDTLKKFIQIQNKLHESVCSKRSLATIATHDFNKLPPGDLLYTTLPPNELRIHPLNRTKPMSGAALFASLQTEANNLRKEKKRNAYSGIHKYLYLIEGRPRYPCLLTSEKVVISFPPITNSDVSKIHVGTKSMLIEVTSSTSLFAGKTAMEALLKELTSVIGDLDVTQIRTTDHEGVLKVVYPSKADLNFEGGDIKVVRSE